MTANELRIGNWVQGFLGEKMQVCQVGHLKEPDYISASNDIDWGQNAFTGILLTPTILRQCGFNNNLSLDYYSDGKVYHTYEFRMVNNILQYGYWGESGFISETRAGIEYLHQLQNLYFALTGTELNYTP